MTNADRPRSIMSAKMNDGLLRKLAVLPIIAQRHIASKSKDIRNNGGHEKVLDISSLINSHDCSNHRQTRQKLALKISPCPLESILNGLVKGGL